MWNKRKTSMAMLASIVVSFLILVPALVLIVCQNENTENASYVDACDLEKMGTLGRVNTSVCLARATQSAPSMVQNKLWKQERDVTPR